MEEDVLIISKEQVSALIDRIRKSNKLDSCLEEVHRMRDIKLAIAWQAHIGS